MDVTPPASAVTPPGSAVTPPGSAGTPPAGAGTPPASAGLRTDWQPATEAESALATAVKAGDQLAYLQQLAATALVLPVTPAAAAGREPVTWATNVADGTTYVLAFTSGLALPPHKPVGAVRLSPLFDIVHAISDLGWGLAIDPGLPIQAFLTPAAVSDLKAWEPVWLPLDAALRSAVGSDNQEACLDALLGAHLVLPLPAAQDIEPAVQGIEPGVRDIVPVPEPEASGEYWTAVAARTDPLATVSRDVTDPEFPWWRTERVDGAPVLLAFSTPARMQAELGEREWVEVSFIELVAAWPDWTYGLRLNPGAGNGMELPGPALEATYDVFLAAVRERNAPPGQDGE